LLARLELRESPVAEAAFVRAIPRLALAGERLRPALELCVPFRFQLDPPLDAVAVLAHLLGDDELRVRVPAERLFRRAHLVLAERRAVRLRSVDRVRCAEADVRADDDERRSLQLRLRGLD